MSTGRRTRLPVGEGVRIVLPAGGVPLAPPEGRSLQCGAPASGIATEEVPAIVARALSDTAMAADPIGCARKAGTKDPVLELHVQAGSDTRRSTDVDVAQSPPDWGPTALTTAGLLAVQGLARPRREHHALVRVVLGCLADRCLHTGEGRAAVADAAVVARAGLVVVMAAAAVLAAVTEVVAVGRAGVVSARRSARGLRRVVVVIAAAAVLAAIAEAQQPVAVAERDRAVVGIGVAVHLLRVAGVDDRVDGDEAAGVRVVFAGAEVGESGGGVDGAADEALLTWPARRRGAAQLAERQVAALADGKVRSADGQLCRAVLVSDLEPQSGTGAYGGRCAELVVAGGGDAA